MFKCMYVYVHARVSEYMHACMGASVYARVCVYAYVYVYVRARVCVCVCVFQKLCHWC